MCVHDVYFPLMHPKITQKHIEVLQNLRDISEVLINIPEVGSVEEEKGSSDVPAALSLY